MTLFTCVCLCVLFYFAFLLRVLSKFTWLHYYAIKNWKKRTKQAASCQKRMNGISVPRTPSMKPYQLFGINHIFGTEVTFTPHQEMRSCAVHVLAAQILKLKEFMWNACKAGNPLQLSSFLDDHNRILRVLRILVIIHLLHLIN